MCALPRANPLRFRFLGPPQRRRLGWACVFCLPRPSSSGSQELDGHTPPGVQSASSPPRSQPQFPRAPVWCTLCPFWEADFWLRPSQQMSTIQSLRKSLVRNWKPVCSLVGDAVSGAVFAPLPSSLPPVSSGGWAGPPLASSSLELLSPSFVLRRGDSMFGWRFSPVNSLSLSCYPTV